MLTRYWTFFMHYIIFTVTLWDILLSSLFCRYSYWGLEKFNNFLKDKEPINGWWLGLGKSQKKMILIYFGDRISRTWWHWGVIEREASRVFLRVFTQTIGGGKWPLLTHGKWKERLFGRNKENNNLNILRLRYLWVT